MGRGIVVGRQIILLVNFKTGVDLFWSVPLGFVVHTMISCLERRCWDFVVFKENDRTHFACNWTCERRFAHPVIQEFHFRWVAGLLWGAKLFYSFKTGMDLFWTALVIFVVQARYSPFVTPLDFERRCQKYVVIF